MTKARTFEDGLCHGRELAASCDLEQLERELSVWLFLPYERFSEGVRHALLRPRCLGRLRVRG